MISPHKAKLGFAAQLLQQGKLAEAEQAYLQVAAEDPANFLAHHNLAFIATQQGLLDKAEGLFAKAVMFGPDAHVAVLAHGKVLLDLNRPADAIAAYDRFLAKHPGQLDVLNDCINPLIRLGRYDQALSDSKRVLQAKPGLIVTLYNQASALMGLRRVEEALASLNDAIAAKPDFAEALFFRGSVLRELKRYDDALRDYDAGIKLHPADAQIANNRGATLMDLKRYSEALVSLDLALKLTPNHVEAMVNRGRCLGKLGRSSEELAAYDATLSLQPNLVDALVSRCIVLQHFKRFDEALVSIERAVALQPKYAKAQQAHGDTLVGLKRLDDAIACYDKALAITPNDVPSWDNRGVAMRLLSRHEESAQCFARVMALKPDHPNVLGSLFSARLHCCDWSEFAATSNAISAGIKAGRRVDIPFSFLCHSLSADDQLTCAKMFAADKGALTPSTWTAPPYRNSRIRIAYLSADFRNHATSHLMAGLFEAHDRSRFEITAVSFTPGDGSDMEKRLHTAFEHFIDVSAMQDAEVVAMLRDKRVDIAVDLKGFTGDSRSTIFPQRPAPIQASFSGIPAPGAAIAWITSWLTNGLSRPSM
ncbi:MAG: tetratricopeptide repeat protein [Rhodospirillaceae bacterium]|nr:tetratricopeptide repeat protein [Rhodospirillaceae bacterium]